MEFMSSAVTQPNGAIFNILIVDDTPASVQLLASMLREKGYKPRAATNGEAALEAARRLTPDLILLDVNMPGMNGYELCKRLKADENLKQVPVLFISGVDDPDEKVRAFRCGGVDYVTKPFRIEEVEARVRAHLEISSQKRELQRNYQQLQELEAMRDNLVHMIVHDMRSPLFVLELLLSEIEISLQSLNDPETAKNHRTALANVRKLTGMTNDMLDINRLEQGKMPIGKKMTDLSKIAHAAMESMDALAEGKTLLVNAPEPVIASCDPEIVGRVFCNLIGNALKFTPIGGKISIAVGVADGSALASVTDTGPGIPPEFHQKIFEKFGQVEGKQKRMGVGLGLTFCKMAVQAHGGIIGIESELKKGSRFWFTIPLAESGEPIQSVPSGLARA